MNFSDIKFVWELRKWLEKCEKLVGKNQRPNWPKLQAQKPEPTEKPIEIETNRKTDGFSTISVGFG